MEELLTQCLLEEAARIFNQPLSYIQGEPGHWIRKLVERLGSNVPGVLAAKLLGKGVQVPTA